MPVGNEPPSLERVLRFLRANEATLRSLGARHVAVFGSVARGEAGSASDVDILVDLDPDAELDLFDYPALCSAIDALVGGTADVANRRKLKPVLRNRIEAEAIHAF